MGFVGKGNALVASVVLSSVLSLSGPALSQQQLHPRTIIVMDGSGSMWGQINEVPKLSIARKTVADVLANVPANMELGLLSYGHRRKGDCGDIELVVPPTTNSSSQILSAVNSMRFLGKTPLSEAVRQAAISLRYTEDQANVVLITDGLETCSADPCALGHELEAAGLDFTVHVVGFGLSEEEGQQVSCLAENTGGLYLQAKDGEGLADALNQTILVAQNEPAPIGMVSLRLNIDYQDGTSRPTEVALSATNLDNGELIDLGKLVGTEQVINGMAVEFIAGPWRFDAVGPVASGSVEVIIDAQTRQVDVPFGAVAEQFSLMNLGPYQLGQDMMFVLRNNAPLQDNATYSVNLFPAGATDYDQRIDFTYKFGNETDGYSSHNLSSPESAGDYEVIVMQGGYDLNDAVARFPVSYVAAAAAGWSGPTSVHPGERFEFKILGQVYRLNRLWLEKGGDETDDIWLDDLFDPTGFHLTAPNELGVYNVWLEHKDQNGDRQREVIGSLNVGVDAVKEAPLAASGLENVTIQVPKIYRGLQVQWSAVPVDVDAPTDAWAPDDITDQPINVELEPGIWEINGDAGDNVFLGRVEVVVGGKNNFFIPYSAVESPAGPDAPEIAEDFDGYVCDGDVACQIYHAETGVSFTLPSGWRAETPYFYQTAGGALYGEPTVTFYGPQTGDEPIVLNPMRWMVANSICTQIRIGTICRYDPVPDSVLQVYEMLAQNISFNGVSGHNSLMSGDVNDLLVQASQ